LPIGLRKTAIKTNPGGNPGNIKGKKMKYIVWVGGVADYEGDSLREAKAIKYSWLALGYDDVILEVIR
jgi:hypothetical protein